MEKISEFQITGLTLSGFKCYDQPVEFAFGNPTIITGGNGRGKSSIADAIAFAVTGLPFFGERGIDRLHTDGQTEAFIALRFTDETGSSHELTRTRMKSRMTITYDGYELRQLDLTELFGEKDVFLSIFNPLYFIEELGDDGKSLLERYLPTISHEEVLSGLSEHVQAALKDESLLSPDTYLKRRREEIRELESNVTYLTGQKDLLETQNGAREKNLTTLTEKLSGLAAEIQALEEKRFDGLSPDAMQEQLVELSARYEDLARDTHGAIQADDPLLELHRRLGERKAAVYAPKYAAHIAAATAKAKELAMRYQQEANRFKGFAAETVCPTCKRPVTMAELPAVREALTKEISDIVAQGKAQTAQIAELTALEKQAKAVFEQFRADDVQKIETEIEALTKPIDTGSMVPSEADTLRLEIQALTTELEYGKLTQEEYARLSAVREAHRAYEAELSALQNAVPMDAADCDRELEETRSAIVEQKKRITDAISYVSRRAELTFSKLNMNRVAISLYDVVKSTGEVKDAFRFTYNGRLYNRLSLSEKIRAGMEVSELMKRLAGRNYPVFVDNMESVEDLANVRPTGQVIMAKCVPGAALSVRPMGGATQQTQSKAA